MYQVHAVIWLPTISIWAVGSQNPFTQSDLERRFKEWMETGEWSVDLICEHERMVGYVVYQQRPDYYPDERVVFVRQFFVKNEYRRQGVGRKAFEQLVRTRFPKGCAVQLDVVAGNSIGQKYWSALGFEPYAVLMKRRVT